MTFDPQLERISFYGTLMRDQGVQQAIKAATKLRHMGTCSIDGKLYDLGAYPGMVEGKGTVLGELYDVLDASVLIPLDRYEEFDPQNPSGSLFIRRRIRLKDPKVDSWVYFFNGSVRGKKRIQGGDWIRFIQDRSKTAGPTTESKS
jgi:gamma-glutamylcyclotransferase (GGCT)/AIG2-like uncharacterized protein YtfP